MHFLYSYFNRAIREGRILIALHFFHDRITMITIVTTRATERAGINAEEAATAAVLSATTLSKFGSAVKKIL